MLIFRLQKNKRKIRSRAFVYGVDRYFGKQVVRARSMWMQEIVLTSRNVEFESLDLARYFHLHLKGN